MPNRHACPCLRVLLRPTAASLLAALASGASSCVARPQTTTTQFVFAREEPWKRKPSAQQNVGMSVSVSAAMAMDARMMRCSKSEMHHSEAIPLRTILSTEGALHQIASKSQAWNIGAVVERKRKGERKARRKDSNARGSAGVVPYYPTQSQRPAFACACLLCHACAILQKLIGLLERGKNCEGPLTKSTRKAQRQ